MHPALQKLQNTDPEARLTAAESMLQRYERKQLHGADTPVVLNELLAFAAAETDEDVQAAVVEALDQAMVHYTGDHAALQWQPLIDGLQGLGREALALALPMLSLCGRADARPIISAYLEHKAPEVREAASFALDELEMMGL